MIPVAAPALDAVEPQMQWTVVTATQTDRLAARMDALAAEGWRLMGPVQVSVSCDGGFVERVYVATFEREVRP